MKLGLHFDSDACYDDLKLHIIGLAEQLSKQMYNEFVQGIDPKRKQIKSNYSHQPVKLNQEIITGEIIAYALAVLDSYGSGSKMDKSNPYLSKYKTSILWNKSRTGSNIVGRAKGTYTNIFGKTVTSKGRKEGKVTGLGGNDSGWKPSYTIQYTESTYFKRTIPKVVSTEMQKWLNSNYDKYFVYR